MVRFSNWVITVLNLLTMLLACSAILVAFKLHKKTDSPCADSLKAPLLVVGGALLVVSFLGVVGACCRVTFFMCLYLLTLIMTLLGLSIFTIYMMFVANKGSVTFFSTSITTNADHWNKLKSCMDEAKFCTVFVEGMDEQYYKDHMSPIQLGCCTPPSYCGFKFENATSWIVPQSSPTLNDRDCSTWSNVQKQLCFDCETCKASFLDDTQKKWKFMTIVDFLVFIFINLVLMTACCAHDNNKDRRYHRGGGYYP